MTKNKRCILAIIYIIYVVAYFLVVKTNRCYDYPYRTYGMPEPCVECNDGEFSWAGPCCPPDIIKKCGFPSLIKNLTSYDIKGGGQFRNTFRDNEIWLQILFLCFIVFLPIAIISNKKWIRILSLIISIISIGLFFRYFSNLSNQAYNELRYQSSRPV